MEQGVPDCVGTGIELIKILVHWAEYCSTWCRVIPAAFNYVASAPLTERRNLAGHGVIFCVPGCTQRCFNTHGIDRIHDRKEAWSLGIYSFGERLAIDHLFAIHVPSDLVLDKTHQRF
jgi:hypothetical protein